MLCKVQRRLVVSVGLVSVRFRVRFRVRARARVRVRVRVVAVRLDQRQLRAVERAAVSLGRLLGARGDARLGDRGR